MMGLAHFRNTRYLVVALLAWLLVAGNSPVNAVPGAWAPAETAHLAIEPAPPGRLPWVVFDERSGLPQHTILDMLVDQRGFAWAMGERP
jgi:hypothetical protein